jgi:hypothetical protein
MTYRELVAVYNSLDDALDDLTALEILHEDRLIEDFDAAVIDQESGRPHIVKRVDRPRIRVIGEQFGSGSLPRQELEAAAWQLGPSQAGLIMVGDPSLEKPFAKLTRSPKLVKRSVHAGRYEIAGALHEALES